MRSKLSSQGIAHRRRPLRDTKKAEDPPSSRKSLREQKSYRGFWDRDIPSVALPDSSRRSCAASVIGKRAFLFSMVRFLAHRKPKITTFPYPSLFADEGLLPAWLLLIDGAPMIRAQLARKAMYLNFSQAIANGAGDDLNPAPNSLFVRNARWLRKLIEQRLFFTANCYSRPPACYVVSRWI